MKIIYRNHKGLEEFWEEYWERVKRDPNIITEKSIYPLFPVDEYVQRDMKILEAGCGMGRVFKHYFNQGYSIVGLEYNEKCLTKLIQESGAFPLVRGDIRSLSFKDEAFDMVMAFGLLASLEHDSDEALEELKRVLKKGGLIFASAVCDNFLRRVENFLYYISHLLGKILRKENQLRFYARAYKPQEWSEYIKEKGFDLVRLEPSHSKILIWQYLPFLREKVDLDMVLVRDGDRGYKLNRLGELVFKCSRKLFPWFVSIATVCIARKR